VDTEDRNQPRFPNTDAAREHARSLIYQAVREELERHKQEEKENSGSVSAPVIAIAGGSCGSDLLFHEVCEQLNIESQMFLALPPQDYVAESVLAGGTAWIDRFDHHRKRLDSHVLGNCSLPDWLAARSGYSIWQRSNLWMLHSALAMSEERLTLISLYDGGDGANPGGTEDMVARAAEHGARHVPLDAKKLLKFCEQPKKSNGSRQPAGRAKKRVPAEICPA
jgi:hypothetical protein